jgi:superfamily II DNA or RNA helicase
MNNFITNNEESTNLNRRLVDLIKGSEELKFLVGFFYFSGWKEIYESLKDNENVKLKILVGLEVDEYLTNIIEVENPDSSISNEEYFSNFMSSLGKALNNYEMDNEEFYNQIEFFIKLLDSERLLIRKTLNPNHAKLYIFKLHPNIFNLEGEFITGSSNLTKAGLKGQEEFNVEIRDYGFNTAERYFDELWEIAIPITEMDGGKETICDFLRNQTQTALITPYEAYAYVLKTYIEIQENKKINPSIERLLEDNGFKKYTYQIDAVNQALNIIETYNGVIVADVVGLGKSVIASLIASQLGVRGLILCPPGLRGDKKQNTGWYEYLHKFRLYDWDIESSGNVENLAESLRENDFGYEAVIIDEAHKFRNQDTAAYEALSDICRGKKVILFTATPFNNSPADIFSLLKLFIVPGESGITIEPNLEGRFNSYTYRFKNLSFILKNYNSADIEKKNKAESAYERYFGFKAPVNAKIVKDEVMAMSNEIKNIISTVTIRRNRIDLKTDLEYKNEVKNLSKIKDPVEIFYELTKEQSEFYDKIIQEYFSENGWFKGAIYKPFEYENKLSEDDINLEENREKQQQKNLYDFMRRLLVKRFESSFGAFEKSIKRFLKTHKMVKSFIEKSGVYFLDRKVIEAIYDDEENSIDFTSEAIEEAIKNFEENSKNKTSPKHTKIYEIDNFYDKEKFLKDIEEDIKLFEWIELEIKALNLVDEDPKRQKVLEEIQKVLQKNEKPKRKIILFTEYTDTVEHLKNYFKENLNDRVLFSSSGITKSFEKELIENFDAKSKHKKDDYDVLIASDKLSEGFNLNRAGLIINYDIPWNPTRVIQRVGRINRIGTKVFNELFIYNLFPTEQGATQVKIREIAEQKMFLIHNALGEDAKIFNVDEQPTASGLFKKLRESLEEDKEEISISTLVRNEFKKVKSEHPEILEKIAKLPNRTKTAKSFENNNTVVLRKKGMALFSMIAEKEKSKIVIKEKTFQELFEYIRCSYEEKRLGLSKDFWKSYEKVKSYNPKYRSGKQEQALENKAINSLKSLLNNYKENLSQDLMVFINILLKDLKTYRTLSKYTIRKLILIENEQEESYEVLKKNIEKVKRQLGSDYLDVILKKVSNIDEDIIIAIENRTL